MKNYRTALVCCLLAWALPACGDSGASSDSGASRPDLDDEFPVAVAEGLAPTPPMGWNSWNRFNCNVSATLIRQTADALVESGLRDAGYVYVNIDDCWAEPERAADGAVQPTAQFPGGIQPIADYVHERGLKLGIYSDRGTQTCAFRAGSQDYEEQDAASYAAWGVDYVKYDNCNATLDIREQYDTMARALRDSGRPMVYSICAWQFYEWGVGMGHLWRTTTDIRDTWSSMLANATNNRTLAAYAGPNGWNDPDMLEVGNGGMTDTEYRAHFSLWSIMAAPLIAGNDLRVMTPETREILTNAEVIAVNQDALGLQGAPVRIDGELSVWAKPLNESGARAVVLFNASDAAADIRFRFDEIGLRTGAATIRDLWAHADLGEFVDEFSASVPPHGAVALRVKGAEPARPVGNVYLSDLTWTYAANALGPVEKDQSNGASAPRDGGPISLSGTTYAKGLGVSAPSATIFRLGRRCTRFKADVGVDDLTNGKGSVVFSVWADGERLFESEVLTGTSAPQPVDVDVSGRSRLKLVVTNAGDGTSLDRASFGDARLECDN